MNVENIKRVRDHIAGLPAERFNMDCWAVGAGQTFPFQLGAEAFLSDCGTCGCIGGWTNAVFREGVLYSQHAAAKRLGLNEETADALFFPDQAITGSYDTITIPEAVAVLDHLIETGEVDWSVAGEVS